MAVAGFEQLLNYMAQADFFTGILPFLLAYVVVFLGAQQVPLVKGSDDEKKYSAMIALIVAFFAANFLVQNPVYQSFFSAYLGRVVIGITGLLGFLTIMGMIGWDLSDARAPLMALIIAVIALSAFGLAGGYSAILPTGAIPVLGISLQEGVDFLLESGLIWLLVIGVALAWVSSTGDSGDTNMMWWFGMGDSESGTTESSEEDPDQ